MSAAETARLWRQPRGCIHTSVLDVLDGVRCFDRTCYRGPEAEYDDDLDGVSWDDERNNGAGLPWFAPTIDLVVTVGAVVACVAALVGVFILGQRNQQAACALVADTARACSPDIYPAAS